MPKPKVTVKKQNSALKQLFQHLNPNTGKGKFLLFLITFAVIGGSYMAYRSFAATGTPVFFIRNSNSAGNADAQFAYGNVGDIAMACDWDGNGTYTIGVYRSGNSRFYIRNSNTNGIAETDFVYGNPGSKPICGDWDGNKKATPGVVMGNTFYLRNSNNAGVSDKNVAFGNATDIPLACDWNGDGKTDIGVYRPSNATFYLSYSTLGWTDKTIPFGNVGDKPLCGDWDGNGTGTIGVYRPGNSTFYLSNDNGSTNVTFLYGNGGDQPIVGDWDGNKTVTAGIIRLAALPPASAAQPKTSATPRKTTYTCVGTTTKEVDSRDICVAILTYAYAGHPDIIARQIAASDVANAGGAATFTPIPAAPAPAPAAAAAAQKTTYTCVGDRVIETPDKATCDAILNYVTLARIKTGTASVGINRDTPPPPAVEDPNAILAAFSANNAVGSVSGPGTTRTGTCIAWKSVAPDYQPWDFKWVKIGTTDNLTQQQCRALGALNPETHHADWIGSIYNDKVEVFTRRF